MKISVPMPLRFFFFTLLLSVFTWQCSGNTTPETSVPEGADPADAVADTAAEDAWLRVNVDNLRMRKGPGMDAATIGELRENVLVTDLGEVSKELSEVTLRGVKHKAPWIKVRTADGLEGWVFGGAVTAVTPETASEAAAKPFSAYLAKLDPKDCSNLERAQQELKMRLRGNTDHKVSDAGIKDFHDFYQDVVMEANNASIGGSEGDEYYLLAYNPDKKPIPAKIAADKKKWDECGIGLEFPEGMLWLVEQPDYMVTHFLEYASPAMREYLLQMQTELREGFAVDAGLTITPQQLAERCAFWDRFQKAYPNFIHRKSIAGEQKSYLGTLMNGLDNTPAFGWEDDSKLNADWKAAYEWLMQTNKDGASGKKIKEYYMLLKKHDFSRSKEVNDFSQKFWQEG